MKFNFLFLLPLLLPVRVLASVEDEAAQAVDLFYDLRFDQAIQSVQNLDAHYPDNPAGLFYLSVAYYQRYLLEDPPSENTFARFQSASEEALDKALKLEKKSPAISHYYQGAVLGFQARTYIAQERYGAAIPKARQGVAQLKKALELDPTLEDANLGLGLYYYFLARVPSAAKPFAYLMVGMWGDREKGLMLLKQVSEKGHTARSEARSVLAAIYASQKERKWKQAEVLFRDMMDKYPHNPRYRLNLVYVLQRQGQWEKAADMANPGGAWIEDLDPLIKTRAQDLARYRAVENLLFANRTGEAGPILDNLEAASLPDPLKEWVALRRGNYWDALGKPEKAWTYYDRIRGKKPAKLAAAYIKTPFPIGPRDVMPNKWPLANIPAQ